MTKKDGVNDQINYAKILNGIRTELASVISAIDSQSKYAINGAMTPESVFFDASSVVTEEEERLEAQKGKVDELVEILNTVKVPKQLV